MTVHLVYPHRRINSSPDSIGWNLFEFLKREYDVVAYDWDSLSTIVPNDGDVLIGHAHPLPFTIFRNSIKSALWKRKIMLQPFNCDLEQISYLDSFIENVDLYLAISGEYWFGCDEFRKFARWAPKMSRMDMAIERSAFPFLKHQFNPVGSRNFLYIGNDHPAKGLNFLDKVASQFPYGRFAWAGSGNSLRYPHLKHLGVIDFGIDSGREVVRNYDFMITVGTYDANPTTILEAMSWGLIPVATKTSGYINQKSIKIISNNSIEDAVSLIRNLDTLDENELKIVQSHGSEDLKLYDWQRFCERVYQAITSSDSPALANEPGPPVMRYPHLGRHMLHALLNNLKRLM